MYSTGMKKHKTAAFGVVGSRQQLRMWTRRWRSQSRVRRMSWSRAGRLSTRSRHWVAGGAVNRVVTLLEVTKQAWWTTWDKYTADLPSVACTAHVERTQKRMRKSMCVRVRVRVCVCVQLKFKRAFSAFISSTKVFVFSAKRLCLQCLKCLFTASVINAFILYLEGGFEKLQKGTETRESISVKFHFIYGCIDLRKLQKQSRNERVQEECPTFSMFFFFPDNGKKDIGYSLIAFFHICLVSVLFSSTFLSDMKFYRTFLLVLLAPSIQSLLLGFLR